MKLLRLGLVLWAAMLFGLNTVHATVLDIGTGVSPNWTVSAGGASDVQPYFIDGGERDLALTSDGFSSGTPVKGLNLSTFDGYWTANLSFFLPSNAINPVLTYSNLSADDRVVLELNGVPIGNAGKPNGGLGFMTLSDGGPNIPYQFSGDLTSGSAAAGFIPSAPNLLEAIINNTDAGINGAPRDISTSDGTGFRLHGTLTYSAVPEPASLSVFLAGLLAVLPRRRGNPAN
jgi:hypothetical protein